MQTEDRSRSETRSLFEREHWPATNSGLRYRLYRLVFHHDSPAERNFDLWLIVAFWAIAATWMRRETWLPPLRARLRLD